MPRAVFEAVQKQAVEGRVNKPFMRLRLRILTAKLEAALDQLYKMIEHHLESVRKRATRRIHLILFEMLSGDRHFPSRSCLHLHDGFPSFLAVRAFSDSRQAYALSQA